MKLAVGYVRCSTEEQGATSIPQQKEELEKWAQKDGFQIIDWFVDEGKSGTSFDKRPAFQKMVSEVEGTPRFQFILVYDESRWGRAMNPRESAYWKVHFEKRKVRVLMMHSSSKQEDDIGSMVIEMVESSEASEYSKKLSRAVRRGMCSSQQGKYSRGGTAPYGYRRVAIDLQTKEHRDLRAGSRCVPKVEKVLFELGDPLEVKTVKRIFEMKVSGMGYVSIADTLNTEGIPSPKRGRWRSKDQKWSGGTINSILQNRTYVGDLVYNRLCFSKFKAKENGLMQYLHPTGDRPKFRNDKSEWIIVPLAHPEIISEELFVKASGPNGEKRPKLIARPNQHFYRSQYLLSGLITCSHCGFNYQGSHHKKTGNRYYVDGGFINKGKSVCSFHSLRQDILEEFVLDSVKELLLEKEMREKIEQQLRELCSNDPAVIGQKTIDIDAQLNDVTLKLKNLISLAEKGVGLDSITDRIRDLEISKRNLEDEKGRLGQNIVANVNNMNTVTEAVQSFLENFEARLQVVPMVEKKDLIRMVVEKIVVNRETGGIDCYIKKLPSIKETEQLKGGLYWVDSVAPTGIEPVFEP